MILGLGAVFHSIPAKCSPASRALAIAWRIMLGGV